jgi:small GTP-binding protein
MLFDEKIQVIIVGESSVGKTSIMTKYCTGSFTHQHLATAGLDYFTRDEKVESRIIRLKIWDTAGQEQFKSLTRNFYKNSDGAIVVFDVSNRNSFDKVQEWIQSIYDSANENVKLILVGNKIDLKREVSHDEGKKFADSYNLGYFETSAKENIGINEMIKKLLADILSNLKKSTDNFLINEENIKDTFGLCRC